MTKAQRETAIERVAILENRNAELTALIERYEPSTVMEEVLVEIMAENASTIDKLRVAIAQRYEFLFNFIGGGWNSEYAHTMEEAQIAANAKYTSEVDLKSFRVSTPSDYNALMSSFY